jgi:hypothetical protein
MAVSLSEAWNDFSHNERHVELPKMETSAKVSREVANNSAYKEMENTQDDQKQEDQLQTAKYIYQLEQIVENLKELRQEEAKRSTVYIAMAAVLFAILFYYIDKLSCKMRTLSYGITRPHVNTFEHDSRQIHPAQFQWLQ